MDPKWFLSVFEASTMPFISKTVHDAPNEVFLLIVTKGTISV